MRFEVDVTLQVNGRTLSEAIGIIEQRLTVDYRTNPTDPTSDGAGVALASVSAKGVTPTKDKISPPLDFTGPPRL